MNDQNLTKLQVQAADTSLPPASSRKPGSMQRFRKNNRRIDYYPAEGALDAIDALHRANPGWSLRELVDYLVVTGYKAASGKQ
jgi:hypothetical protein